jgi:hypothetical protein
MDGVASQGAVVIRPTVGELLAGVVAGLRNSVLCALPPGDAQRQLKAALHVLDRLQRSWDLQPAYLAADNADMRETLQSVLESLPADTQSASVADSLRQRLTQTPGANPADLAGINDRSLAAQAQLNMELQQMVMTCDSWLRARARTGDAAAAEQGRRLDHLYGRMVDRELQAVGDGNGNE